MVQELNSIREGKCWDDVKGGGLDPVLIRKAREEEMQYVRRHAVYKKVPLSQCWKETGKHSIKRGRADTKKGTSECPNRRSRWVAKEYNTDPGLTLLSATSPLEGRCGCETRHLGSSVHQKGGGQCTWGLMCGERTSVQRRCAESTSCFPKEMEEYRAASSVGC